ncbi:MAG: SGNH/GDSL hydrolase family protein [Gammaproteobacteria bacterium]|nr:SGNH/GDSL hydrolase family protein [Gammaproteobacteria bacterium]
MLLPLLLPQALYVRKNAPRFAPADGPSNGTLGYGKQARLLAIGDSIIAGVGATTLSNALVGQTATALATLLDGGVNWQALGVSGYSSEKVLNRLLPKLPETKFDYVILSVGVNDVTGLTTLRQWRRNLNFLLSRLQAHSPDAVIAVAGLPPLHGFPLLPQPLRAVFGMRGRTFDEELRKILEGLPNCVYAPLDFDPDPSQFAPDGYHPSEESYAVYGQHLADKLIKANI